MNKDFLFTDKYLDLMSVGLREDRVNLIVFEGTIRSIKTTTAIQLFFERMQLSNERMHLLAAENLDAIRDNLLQHDFGLEICYKDFVKRRREEIGGYYLESSCFLNNRPKIKKNLMCGYSRASDWEKILGKTLGVILVDEVNNANEQFIDECFARQTSADSPLMIWTLNGDDPTHWIYQKYINRCNILFDAPASIKAEMMEAPKEKGWYYCHFTMKDNPIMTSDKIKRAESIYPIGSYYHTIKILGERGSHGELLYLDYLDKEKHIKEIDVRNYQHFVIGADIGATRAFNSFALVGFSRDFKKVALIDLDLFKQCGYKEKTERLFIALKRWEHLPIRTLSIDSAELNYISDIKTLMRDNRFNIEVIPSYKATIKQRIDLMIIMLSHNMFSFNNTEMGKISYDSFMKAKKSMKSNEWREDKNEMHIDIIDSIEYALTRHMNSILQASRKYEKELIEVA